MGLPHIQEIKAGAKLYDPVNSSVFEVTLRYPTNITGIGDHSSDVLSQQVTQVSGLDALQKTSGVGEQKFRGVTVSFLNPTLDTTAADITVTFNLNINLKQENYVLEVIRAWANLGYDITSGTRTLKHQYATGEISIAEANRNGHVWRAYTFKNVMITNVTNLDTLDYSQNEARTLQVSFRSDWWTDTMSRYRQELNYGAGTDSDVFKNLGGLVSPEQGNKVDMNDSLHAPADIKLGTDDSQA